MVLGQNQDQEFGNQAASRTIIKIQGQEFMLSGPVAIDPASDFAQGIKTGPASFDTRLHSFFDAVDDFSAGVGYDRIDIREDIGVYNSISTYPVDTRRSKHTHAAPYLERIWSWIPDGTGFSQNRNPMVSADGVLVFGDRLVTIHPFVPLLYTDDGWVWRYEDTIGGTNAYWALSTKLAGAFHGESGTGYFILNVDDGVVPNAMAIYFTDPTGTISQQGPLPYWDIIYSRISEQFFSLGNTGVTIGAGTYPTAGPSSGNLPSGQGQILGEMTSPHGNPAIYFSKGGKLFYAERFYSEFDGTYVTQFNESVVGTGFHVGGSTFFNGALALTDGLGIKTYQTGNFSEIIRPIGLEFRSMPSVLEGGLIRGLAADENNLYAGMQVADDLYILAYNGRGWNIQGKIDSFYLQHMFTGRIPASTWPTTSRGLYLVGTNVQENAVTIRPSGNGNYTAWTGTTGVYTDYDDDIPDDATTFITSTALNDRESWTHSKVDSIGRLLTDVLSGKTVVQVNLVARCRTSTANPSSIKLFRRSAGVDTDGSSKAVTSTSWTTLRQPWFGLSLTAADINAMEFGIKKDADADGVDCTQMYVELVWTSGVEAQIWKMHLPISGSIPRRGTDRFMPNWGLRTSWVDGGFVDLRGGLYNLQGFGTFDSDEYMNVYYSTDFDETNRTLLGTIDEDGHKLLFGHSHEEGISFRNYRLDFEGIAGVPDVTIPSSAATSNVALGDAAGRVRIAQSFTVTADTKLDAVRAYMRKENTSHVDSTHYLVCNLMSNSGSSPNAVLASTVKVVKPSEMLDYTNMGWRTFVFDTNNRPTLTAGTTYWIEFRVLLRTDGTTDYTDASSYYRIATAPDATYATYTAKSGTAAQTYTALTADLVVEIITDKTKTADMRGYVVNYNKRPKFRVQFQAPIDVQGMIDADMKVDGETPTLENVYAKCIDLWNSETLLEYEIPGVRKGHCMLSAMPSQFDDIGPYREPSGRISLQILEPTQSHTEET